MRNVWEGISTSVLAVLAVSACGSSKTPQAASGDGHGATTTPSPSNDATGPLPTSPSGTGGDPISTSAVSEPSSDSSLTSSTVGSTESSSLGESTTPDVCPKFSPEPAEANGSVSFPFEVTSGGEPLAVGEDRLTADGVPYSVSLFGLFLSQPRLETASGALVAAQFLTEDGEPAPYDVYYYHSEVAPARMHLKAPAGTYQALHLHLGVPDECLGAVYDAPLNADSEMYWSWGASFMAIRLEGRASEADAAPAGFAYHLGPIVGTPLVKPDARIAGDWILSEEGEVGATLRLDLANTLAPKPADGVIATHALVADWLITNLADSAFSLEP